MLDEACRQAARWQRRYPDARDWTISVNVSVKQLQTRASSTRCAQRAARRRALDPRRLILEITESVMMHDVTLDDAAPARR